jgi:ferredoxin
MASLLERLAPNAVGRFYVDASCIDCDFCRSTAPEFFSKNEELGLSVVHRQPVTPAEVELAEDALNGCPTCSIGSDGC